MKPASILDVIFARRVSVRIFGLAAVALGLVGLVWGDFAAVWQPVPKDLPGRTALAYAVAIAFLMAGLAMQWRRSAGLGALALTALYALGVILLHVPRVIAHPSVFVTWSGVAEQLALVAGGLVAYAYCAKFDPPMADRLSKIGRLIFGVCLIVFALAHLFYLAPTAELVPKWLPPGQTFWAYATAAGHFAAGIAILSGVLARTAAMLLTSMFVVFGILVHAPTIFIDPHTHFNWAANAINFALIGSAWVIASHSASSPTARAGGVADSLAGKLRVSQADTDEQRKISMHPLLRLLFILLISIACTLGSSMMSPASAAPAAYLDSTGRDDVLSGGVKMISIQTPKGAFRVWTKRVGNNPTIKVLLLHGGPGATHEYFEAFDSYFPNAGIEYYYYDQLGSAYSDQPDEPSLWDIPRFVEEVEQVRKALKLDKSNFYLYGQSWGGILALEYALKYQQNLKALVISNMVASIPAYNRYAASVLMPAMDQKALADIKDLEAKGRFDDPRYEELLMAHFYVDHILRMPQDQWPDPVVRAFNKINKKIYIPMQGPSEMGASGKLLNWDRTADLPKIAVPTLAIGAHYDTMEPAQMEKIAKSVKKGRYLYCPKGSHLAIYDDQQVYMAGLTQFILDVNAGRF